MAKRNNDIQNVHVIDLAGFITQDMIKSLKGFPSVEPMDGDGDSDKWNAKNIPLFLCESYEQLKADGFNIPREFVVETALLPNPEYEGSADATDDIANPPVDANGNPQTFCEIARENLRMRIELLKKLDSRGVPIDDIRDWCSGGFRRYLFLDSQVHGTAGTMDLKEICSDDPEVVRLFWAKWFSACPYCGSGNRGIDAGRNDNQQNHNRIILRNRFGVDPSDEDKEIETCANDPLLRYKSFLKWLYSEEYSVVGKFCGLKIDETIHLNGAWLTTSIKNAQDFFAPFGGGGVCLPMETGLALKFASPREHIRILLVDDNANEEAKKLKKEAKLGGLFEFETLELKAGGKANADFVREAIDAIKKKINAPNSSDEGTRQNKTDKPVAAQPIGRPFYDCILLDLCLGETAGSDLSGYQLIKYFRQLMPLSPVIIFSEHEDMGHMTRAFHEGACWFLKKSEAGEKLARHFMSLLALAEWKREWRAIGGMCKINVDAKDPTFKTKFERKEEWNYLTAKCLESLPGQFIQVKQMGGGISGAITFKAQKGMNDREGDAQAPVIIKIDSVFNTRMEYERYFRFIRPYIANEAGRVEQRERVLDRDNAAIVYTFAGRTDSAHHLDTLSDLIEKDMFSRETCDYEKYRKTFDSLFDEILPKLHKVTPELEFRDKDAWPELVDGKPQKSPFSDFPNHFLGELDPDEKTKDPWFLSNYSYRMPIENRIEDFTIVTPRSLKDELGGGHSEIDSLEVFDVHRDDPKSRADVEAPYRYVIECLHKTKTGRYEKIRLTGDLASFYARFRKHMFPGMVLPVVFEDVNPVTVVSWEHKDGELRMPFIEPAAKDARTGAEKFHPFQPLKIDDEFDYEKENPVESLRESLVGMYNTHKDAFECPVGIVHGDLNFRNIMVESRIHPPKEKEPDVTKTIVDVWLIDFARTRRDVIAHDFNVAFTAMLPLLYQDGLVGVYTKSDIEGCVLKLQSRSAEQAKYLRALNKKIKPFLEHVLFDTTDAVADVIADDKRLVFVYKILRRIRKAALRAGISEDMYLLTTALACLYTFKIYYKQKMPDAAAALVLTALLCEKRLRENLDKKK